MPQLIFLFFEGVRGRGSRVRRVSGTPFIFPKSKKTINKISQFLGEILVSTPSKLPGTRSDLPRSLSNQFWTPKIYGLYTRGCIQSWLAPKRLKSNNIIHHCSVLNIPQMPSQGRTYPTPALAVIHFQMIQNKLISSKKQLVRYNVGRRHGITSLFELFFNRV